MTLEQVRAVLATKSAELSDLGITGLSVYGSVARGEEGPDSDVNMLVDLDPVKRVSRFGFVGIQLALEDLLGAKVDLVERSAVAERWRERVENEAVRAA